MLTEEQLQDQCSLIKKMLEVSPYFDGCTVTYTDHDKYMTTFIISNCYYIRVYWNVRGLHRYDVGYYKEYDDGNEEVVLSYGKQSINQCCVRIVKDMYENQLQIASEQWAEEKVA